MSQTKINGVKIDVRLLNQALALKLEEALSELPLVINIAEVYIATIYKQFKCYCIQLYTDTPTCK
jgi:hypothetical protein